MPIALGKKTFFFEVMSFRVVKILTITEKILLQRQDRILYWETRDATRGFLTSFWGSFVNLFFCKYLEKYLGSTYMLRWTRRKSRRWLAQWARVTAHLKSVSSPHPKNSWRRNWMPGSKVSEEFLSSFHKWCTESVKMVTWWHYC